MYTLRNGVVRAEDEEDNLYTAVDLVANKVHILLLLQYKPMCACVEVLSNWELDTEEAGSTPHTKSPVKYTSGHSFKH